MSSSRLTFPPRRAAQRLPALLALAAVAAAGRPAPAAAAARVSSAAPPAARLLREFSWRSIGPANMGGRVSDFAVVEKRPATFYVALGTGGVFKTVNAGTTWSAVFEKQPVASVGAVAVWQKNPDVVWVGTGEANSRNSSSWGNGVYRSTDGGGTWTHVGLEATHNIARIAVDPSDSSVAYVAALGRLWGESPERGVFKTTNGGRTWSHVLRVDARTGAVDLVMDPSNPRTLYAALYARLRTPWSYTGGGTTGGIFKTTDAGRTWTKLANGLPRATGRIGLDVYRKDPRYVLAVVESDEGGRINDFESKSRTGGVFRSEDGGEHWTRLSAHAPRPFYFSQIRVQPDSLTRVYLLGFDTFISDDGGRTFRAGGARNLHGDCHALWIDPRDGDRVLLGTDGGIYLSHDRAENWDFINNLAVGEFYNVAVDMREPYWVYGGLQDNQNWGGPSRTLSEYETWLDDVKGIGLTSDQWFCLGGGDGFHVAVDPTNPDIVYFESQGGWIQRVDRASGAMRLLRPSAKEGEETVRFNWNTPFQISPHDPTVLWMGGNRLFRLYERGDKWEAVSPDLSARHPDHLATGGSGAETHCTIVTLAESPVTRGVLWAGTDDGKVWITPDGGAHWTDRTARLSGVPRGLYVSRMEASHHDARTAYVAIDGHRSNVFAPYLLVTRDGGASWRSIVGDLPRTAPVKVVREDLSNPDLLFAGTEFGLYVTLDGGRHWSKFDQGLPTVAVDDIVIHPRDRDVVIGTHGRSVYVLDDASPLEQWTARAAVDSVTLFRPRPATAYHKRYMSGLWGQRIWTAKNPAFGAYINYFVRETIDDGVSIAIADSTGGVRRLSGPGTPGFHRVVWDLQGEKRRAIDRPEWSDQPEFVRPGEYKVTLTYGEGRKPLTTTLTVRHAPGTQPEGL